MPASQSATAHRLLQLGVLLFLIGLVVGLTLPVLANPRMGLASHMEGVMNGLFLIALGLVWPTLTSSPGMQRLTFLLAVYGTFANLVATFLSAPWGAGAPMMPIAAGGHEGSSVQELVIRVMLVSLALADIAACVLVLLGLRRPPLASA